MPAGDVCALEHQKVEVFELGEGVVGGDEAVAAGEGKGGEVGVHPEFGGSGVAGGEGLPMGFEIAGFGGEGDAGIGEEGVKELPGAGVGVGEHAIGPHDSFSGEKSQEGLLNCTTEKDRGMCVGQGKPSSRLRVEGMGLNRDGNPYARVRKIHVPTRPLVAEALRRFVLASRPIRAGQGG